MPSPVLYETYSHRRYDEICDIASLTLFTYFHFNEKSEGRVI